MDEQLLRELRALRAKAYGPEADLDDDPQAMRRLRELEELAREAAGGKAPFAIGHDSAEAAVADAPQEDAAAAAATASGAASAPGTSDVLARGATAGDPASAAPPARWSGWTSKRIAFAWISSLVIATVAAAAVAGAVTRRVQADPREVAVLGVDDFATWPGIFAGSQSLASGPGGPVQRSAFTDFYGMVAYSVGGGWLAGTVGETCILLLDSALIRPDSNSIAGPTYVGCAAGDFPASVQIVVSPELPDALRQAFPDGTGLQFVLEDDEVVVLSDTDTDIDTVR